MTAVSPEADFVQGGIADQSDRSRWHSRVTEMRGLSCLFNREIRKSSYS